MAYGRSMNPNISEWITTEFLEQSLESDGRYQDIEISDFKVSLAAPTGNNPCSPVNRVTMNCKLRGDPQKLSIIVKGSLNEHGVGEIVSQMKNTEPSFYSVFLPEAKKLSKFRFAPDSFQSPIPSVVVMEDLKEVGYLTAEGVKQLDFEHCLLYTKAAAAFHASSIALYKKKPDMISSVCGETFYSDTSIAKTVLENINKWAIECMANHITNPKVSRVVKDSAEHIWRLLVELHRPSGDLNCILQGDPWTTNMMFKYDSRGNVCDIKLLDFQNLTFGSPVHDLVFFIWLSANNDVRKNRLNDLYSNYLEELNGNLRNFSCPEVSFENFIGTVKKFSPLALITAATSGVILGDSPVDFGEIFTKALASDASVETNPIERYYTEDFYQTVLPQMVDALAAEEVFDYLEDEIKGMLSEQALRILI